MGPQTGCGGSPGCMCKDVCNMQNSLEAYTYKDQSDVTKAGQKGEVESIREGYVASVQCPANVAKTADSQQCGINGNVGEDCTLPASQTGVGQCATHPTTNDVTCLNVCDSSFDERVFGRGGEQQARDSYSEKYNANCTWTAVGIFKTLLWMLLVLAIVGFIVLAGIWIWFNFGRRKPARSNVQHRALNRQEPPPQMEITPPAHQELPAPAPMHQPVTMQPQQQPQQIYLTQPTLVHQQSHVSTGYMQSMPTVPTYTSSYTTHGGAYYQHVPQTTPMFSTVR